MLLTHSPERSDSLCELCFCQKIFIRVQNHPDRQAGPWQGRETQGSGAWLWGKRESFQTPGPCVSYCLCKQWPGKGPEQEDWPGSHCDSHRLRAPVHTLWPTESSPVRGVGSSGPSGSEVPGEVRQIPNTIRKRVLKGELVLMAARGASWSLPFPLPTSPGWRQATGRSTSHCPSPAAFTQAGVPETETPPRRAGNVDKATA